ncbi:MAG: coenzyme F420-0:L-glutamate ligase [Spongiibacteraceae bacterium]
MTTQGLTLWPLPNFPLVEPGDDLAALISASLAAGGHVLQEGDLLVLAQKVISKAEGRYAYLNEVVPSAEAEALALECDKDPRHVELILRESNRVVRKRPGVIIVEHKLGYVHANAGIDRSNISSDEDNPRVLLLPEDSDASAEALRLTMQKLTGVAPHIIINDSAGRAWRNGTLGFSLGSAGFLALQNRVGDHDLFGKALEVTEIAVADELAAAASFLMGQAAESVPVVLIRGADLIASDAGSASLIRDAAMDMFR